MLSFPDSQNMFSTTNPNANPNNAPVPNFDRRTATTDFDNDLEDQMKNISISSLNLFNSRMFHMSLGRLCSNDQSEQVMLEDFTKYCSTGVYKAVAVVETDTEEEKSLDRYDTD